MTDPEIIRLTLKAQKHLNKSTRMDEPDGIEAQFCVQDILDRLGESIDRERSKT